MRRQTAARRADGNEVPVEAGRQMRERDATPGNRQEWTVSTLTDGQGKQTAGNVRGRGR